MSQQTLERLTAKQKKVLAYVEAYCIEHGHSPTTLQIAEALTIHQSAAHLALRRLEVLGLIKVVHRSGNCVRYIPNIPGRINYVSQ